MIKTREEIAELLKKIPIFNRLSEEEIAYLVQIEEEIQLKQFEALFHQGTIPDGLYVLLRGKLHVAYRDDHDEMHDIGNLYPGELVGEMGIISNEPRAATVTAKSDSVLLKFSQEPFLEYYTHHPILLQNIIAMLIERNRKNIRSKSQFQRHNLLLPLNCREDARELLNRIITLTKNQSSVKILQASDFKNKRKAQWYEYIHRLEEDYDTLIYFCEDYQTDWFDFALTNAHNLYLLTGNVAHVEMLELETKLLDYHRRHPIDVNFVNLSYPRKPFSPALLKLGEQLEIKLFHHVELGAPKNKRKAIERLIRFLTGTATGLVLGGGGAKGWAEVGVIKALEEADIEIDIIGGSSIGAIVGACYAEVQNHSALSDCFAKIVSEGYNPISFNQITWPRISFFSSAKTTNRLNALFLNKKIQDLPLPYFAISTNFTQQVEKVHKRGLIRKIVRASCSIPGLVPPCILDDELHLDGGLLNNLPTDVMRDLIGQNSTIIAVDISSLDKYKEPFNFPPVLKFIQSLRSYFQPEKYKFPEFLDFFIDALQAGASAKHESNLAFADIMIKPDLRKFSLRATKKRAELLQIGYEATKKALEEYKNHD